MSKRVAQANETYNKLLETALDLASEGGLKNITAGKLAIRAKVSKSNVFNHFKTVDGIWKALFDELIFFQLEAVKGIDVNDVDSLIDIISETIKYEDERTKKYAEVFLSFHNESMFSESIKNQLNDYLEHSIELVSKKIEGCNNVNAKPETIKLCARLIFSSLDGIGLHMLTSNNQEQYEKSWQLQKVFILSILKKGA